MSDPILECRNPHHPPGTSRCSMTCIKENSEVFVFQCKTCLEQRRLESIQVKTRAAVRQQVRAGLAARNQLLKALPPKIRKVVMDESARRLNQQK